MSNAAIARRAAPFPMSSWAQQQQLLAAARLTLGAGVASASRACSAAASAACASTTAISSARHAASERVPPAAAPQEQAQTTPHPGEQIQPRDGSLRAVTASSSACDHVTGRQSSHHQARWRGVATGGWRPGARRGARHVCWRAQPHHHLASHLPCVAAGVDIRHHAIRQPRARRAPDTQQPRPTGAAAAAPPAEHRQQQHLGGDRVGHLEQRGGGGRHAR